MNPWKNKIDSVDISLFAAVHSESSPEDRRSLLNVQKAVADKLGSYTYLEIGSHLGGTLQPHLADTRCQKIFSIDPRPEFQPDDGTSTSVFHYQDNSSERMLRLLDATKLGDIAKIQCIELDASQVDMKTIEPKPQIAFIDGEHTERAVRSDFAFCQQIIDERSVILFHDYFVIAHAIIKICDQWKKRRPIYPIMLEGQVFAIFFDKQLFEDIPYFATRYEQTQRTNLYYRWRSKLKQLAPEPVRQLAQKLRLALQK